MVNLNINRMNNLNEILQDAIEWAKGAGEIQLKYFRTNDLGIETKTSVHDVVTKVDKECEDYLINKISEKYPDHSVLGEESGAHQHTSDYLWVIDPLDGTNNYSQGLPVFCVSIGIKYKNEPVVGVVFTPYLNEMFTAVKGKGAFLNNKKIAVSQKTKLNESVLATGFPYDKDVNPDNNVDNIASIIPTIRGLRRMGAAAYDLCCVAAGILDGYWEFNLQPWDVCAGELIVTEAGGEIIPFRNDRNIAIVAANGNLAHQIYMRLHNKNM